MRGGILAGFPSLVLCCALRAAGPVATWRGAVNYEQIAAQTDPYAAVDVMAEFGVNLLTRLPRYNVSPQTAAATRKFLAYARTKGVRAVYMPTTAVYNSWWVKPPEGVTPQTWPCVGLYKPFANNFYCWADDREIEHSAERFADFLEYVGAEDAYLILHPVDTGPDGNPENWMGRCAKCRARWKDGERWKASANQCNIWSRLLRRRCPKAILGSCLYPYTLGLLMTPEDRRDEAFNRDIVEYFRHMDEAVEDPAFNFQSWIIPAAITGQVARLIRKHPVMEFDTFPQDSGIFATYGRHVAPSMITGREPSAFVPYTNPWPLAWETAFFTAAHLMDPDLPGTEPFDGVTYYDPLVDHTGPAVCITNTLRSICRRFWGETLAPDMETFLASGVLPGYIQDTSEVLYWWNRVHRMPLFDPDRDYKKPGKKAFVEVYTNTLERMQEQAACASVAFEAISRAAEKAKGVSLGRVQRDSLAFRLRSSAYWLAAARTKANLMAFRAAFGRGDLSEAGRLLEKAKSDFERDYATAEKGGSIRPKEWKLDRAALQPDLDRAALMMREIASPDPSAAEARLGRPWTPWTPAPVTKPKDARVWSGHVVVDRPIREANLKLYIEPGTKVEFRGEGRLEFPRGGIVASGVTFTADSVLTNAYRITLERGSFECVSCTFKDLRCVFDGSVRIWAPGSICVNESPGVTSGPRPRIEGCRFENCSALGIMPSLKAVYRNNCAIGGDVALSVCGPSHEALISGNRFEGQSKCAVQLLGGDDALLVGNVFVGAQAGGAGIRGQKPQSGLCVLNNVFRDLREPVLFTGAPVSAMVFGGNYLKGCGGIRVRGSTAETVVERNNVLASER